MAPAGKTRRCRLNEEDALDRIIVPKGRRRDELPRADEGARAATNPFGEAGADVELSRPRHRFSMSLVNADHPDVYYDYRLGASDLYPGFVIAGGDATQARLKCSYPTDSGTIFIRCIKRPSGGKMYGRGLPGHDEATRTEEAASEGTRVRGGWEAPWDRECVPGCSPSRCGVDPPWSECGFDTCQQCAHGPDDLKGMLEEMGRTKGSGHQQSWGYNELIFLAPGEPPFSSLMPGIVEAIFIQAGANRAYEQRGRELHARFLAHFGTDAEAVPLVVYSNREAAPFRLAAPAGAC